LPKRLLVDARCLKLGTAWRAGHRGSGRGVELSVSLGDVGVEFNVSVALLVVGDGGRLAGRRRRSGGGGWHRGRGGVEARGAAKRGGRRRAACRRARLDVVELCDGAAEETTGDVAVNIVVDGEAELWEEDESAVVVAVKATSLGATVSPQTE
jgi:hypothetical protein